MLDCKSPSLINSFIDNNDLYYQWLKLGGSNFI